MAFHWVNSPMVLIVGYQGQRYNVGEKSTDILYTYYYILHRHAAVVVVVVFTLKAVPVSIYSVLSNIRTGPTDANERLPWSQANYPERVHIS